MESVQIYTWVEQDNRSVNCPLQVVNLKVLGHHWYGFEWAWFELILSKLIELPWVLYPAQSIKHRKIRAFSFHVVQ